MEMLQRRGRFDCSVGEVCSALGRELFFDRAEDSGRDGLTEPRPSLAEPTMNWVIGILLENAWYSWHSE